MSRSPRAGGVGAVALAWACALGAALGAAGAGAAGCAGTPPGEDPPPRARIEGRSLAVSPIVDRSGALSASETAALAKEIRDGLRELSKSAFAPGHTQRGFPLAESPTRAALLLEVTIEEFDPDGSPALALAVGLGAGRPSYEVVLRLATAPTAMAAPAPAPSTATAQVLGDHDFERSSRRWEKAPAESGGARGVMLHAIASEAVGFVRRRR